MKLLYTLTSALFISTYCTAAMVQYNVPTAAEVFHYPVYFDEATKEKYTQQLHQELAMNSIEYNDIDKFIALGADLDWKNKDGQNALMIAIQTNRNSQAIYFLVKRTNNLYAKDKKGRDIYAYADACDKGSKLLISHAITKAQEINAWLLEYCINKHYDPKSLIERGANVNALSPRGYKLLKPLEVAATWKFTKLLLQNGAKVDREQSFDYLCNAIKENRFDIVSAYVSQGKADVNMQNCDGDTALIFAASEKQWDCVKVLLNAYADPYIKNNEGKTFFDILKNESWVGVGLERKEIMAHVNTYNSILDRKILNHPLYKSSARAIVNDTLAEPQILGGASKDLQQIVNAYADLQ